MMMQLIKISAGWLLVLFVSFLLDETYGQGSLPRILTHPVDSRFVRGSSGELHCDVKGDPEPSVTWYKDNYPVELGGKVSQLDDNSLFFKRIRKRVNDGIYWCVATNPHGQVNSKKVSLTVTYLSRKFKMRPTSKDLSLLGSVRFGCQPPSGNPPPTVKWKKDSIELETNERIKTEVVGPVYNLLISKVLQEDTGNYSCAVSNEAGMRTSEPAVLRVLVPPSIMINEAVIEVNEEGNVEFSCQVNGVPAPSLKWYKEAEELPLLTRLEHVTPNRIRIKGARLSDAGVYTCRAVNSEGFAEENITVIVRMFPKFLIRPESLKVGVGQKAHFECKVAAHPGYKRIWQKTVGAQTSLMYSDPLLRTLIAADGSLTIENVQKEDEARYVCTVISGEKAVSATARLTVSESIAPLPTISVVPLNQTVLEGKDFKVTCVARGTPRPKVYWKSAASDAIITNLTEGVVLSSTGRKHVLILKRVRTSDSGSYRCIATNFERMVSKVAYLKVVPVPKFPDPPDYVDYRNVTETSVVLRWKASRNPPGAPVKSYVVSVSDRTGRVWKAIASNIKKLEYTVRNLKPNTWYDFRITAVSRVGNGKKSRSTGHIKTRPLATQGQPSTSTSKPTSKSVDKLLDLNLIPDVFPRRKVDEFNITWVPVSPSNRVNGYEVHWKRASDPEFKNTEVVSGGGSNHCILRGLEPGTPYEVKIRAFNGRYDSSFSSTKAFSTLTEQQVSIPPPHNVKVTVVKQGSIQVTWEPSTKKGLSGYEIVWIPLDGTSVETKTVGKNATSFLITKLDPEKTYHVTLALVVNNQPGLKSQKLQIRPKLAEPNRNDGEKINKNRNEGGGNSKKKFPDDGETASKRKENRESGVMKIIKEPWFIVSVGGFFFILLCLVVISIVCRRRRQKQPYLNGQSNGLLQPNRTPVNSINRTRASYRDSAFLWGEQDTQNGPPSFVMPSNNSAYKMANGTLDRSEMKPLIASRANETIEMRSKQVNGDVQRTVKEANNLRRPYEAGSVSSSNKDTYLNNLKNEKSIERHTASPKTSLNRTTESKQQEKPRLKIQGAFDGQQTSFVDDEECKKGMLERHAEIVRTSNKKFDSDLANCMENNTQATWKREKMKEAPEVMTSGEDTLRRKGKNSFKPLPKLEVLNWADYPTAHSKAGSSAGSPPSSPKTSASAFSDNNGSRATSRASQGSSTSLNKYPYGGRSGHAPSVSSRRMSQSSSMMSSELYQSEMEPSVYSDAASEKKKSKNKTLPPPIDLDGLTSDILLQWAESVTNSSPSSSGSSSPSRLSVISSDGSFLTDEDFAHAVAAVVKCGGFTDFDYSLSNMPGLQAPASSQQMDHQQKLKMEKIDAMISSKGKQAFRSNGASSANPHALRQDTCSPPSVTPISFSSYLSNNSKRGGANSLSNGPFNKHRQRPSNQNAANDVTALRFASNDNDAALSFGSPLTMSNLRQHDSSLGREKKLMKPLTVSNLKQHDSSLERNKKLPAGENVNDDNDDDNDGDNDDDDDDDNVDNDVFDGKNGLTNGDMAQPLSVISALERNESLGSTKDSRSSINSELEGRGTSERRKDTNIVLTMNDPTSSTGTSTASTVKTSQEQSEC